MTLDNIEMMKRLGLDYVVKGFRSLLKYRRYDHIRIEYGVSTIMFISRCVGNKFIASALTNFMNGESLPSKDEIDFGNNWKQVTAIEWYDEFFVKKRDNNFYSQCGKILTKISKEMDIMPKRIEDTKYLKNCYYIAIVDKFRKRLSDGCVFQNLVKYYKNNDRPSNNNNPHIERSLF